jgi:hypothetical protein
LIDFFREAVVIMHINNSQLFPKTMPEPATYALSQPPVNLAGEQASAHGLQWAERALVSDTAVARSRRNTPSMPVASVTTTSTLNKVSDPKLEIKKVATSPNGLYGLSYSLSAPGAGLSNITFPMSIDEGLQRKGSKDAGIYYAMQFGVNDAQSRPLGRGYIGMQPRGDGKALIAFSGNGAHFKAPQGRPEFDGGKGASNSTLVDFKFGNKYNLTVERDPEDAHKLRGFIQDVTDPDKPGPKQHVKDIYVDQKFALSGRERGFVEHYGAKIDRSSQIAPTRGSFSAPFTTDDMGNVRIGEIKSDGFYGRYKNSMVGQQQVISEAGKGKEIQFSFQGVGYEKKA